MNPKGNVRSRVHARITSFAIISIFPLIFSSFGYRCKDFSREKKKIDRKSMLFLICSCNTWILLRSTTRSTLRQLMISVTMMQLKLSLQCSDKKGWIPSVAHASANIQRRERTVFRDSRVAVYTRRDYVSLPSLISDLRTKIHMSQRISE